MMPLIQFVVAFIVTVLAAWLINTHVVVPEGIKPVVNAVLMLIIVGMGLWLINTYVPMAGSIKALLNIVVVAAVCVRVLQAVGLWSEAVRLWRNRHHVAS